MIGDKYIVAASPTGAWSAYNEGDVAVWGRSLATPATVRWQRFQPMKGWRFYNEDTDQMVRYDGSSWTTDLVRPDWTQTDSSAADYIQNVPTALRNYVAPTSVSLTAQVAVDFTATATRTTPVVQQLTSITLNDEQLRLLYIGAQPFATLRSTSDQSNSVNPIRTTAVLTISVGGVSTSSASRTFSSSTEQNPQYAVIITDPATEAARQPVRNGWSGSLSTTGAVNLRITTTASSDSFRIFGTLYWGIR